MKCKHNLAIFIQTVMTPPSKIFFMKDNVISTKTKTLSKGASRIDAMYTHLSICYFVQL